MSHVTIMTQNHRVVGSRWARPGGFIWQPFLCDPSAGGGAQCLAGTATSQTDEPGDGGRNNLQFCCLTWSVNVPCHPCDSRKHNSPVRARRDCFLKVGLQELAIMSTFTHTCDGTHKWKQTVSFICTRWWLRACTENRVKKWEECNKGLHF